MKSTDTRSKTIPTTAGEMIVFPNNILTKGLVFLFLALCFASQLHAAPLVMNDQIISKDTEWSGEIIINGVVVVGRQAKLNIAPGSKISFNRIDRNNDGIGDGEIRVLGAIRAEGRPDARIIFTSADPKPAPKDWSYLLIFTSPAVNLLSWCDFHYGFSGLQVHFSTASVEKCNFTNNHEGLRFGRADLNLTGNLFTENDIGIRFTRMEGPVRIIGNDIRKNRIGLFLVPSGQNIRDFFEPDRSGIPWNTGHLQIEGNNIYNNSSYNLNLGEKQQWDLEISGNYWGSPYPATIKGKIFDRNRDETLGQALFKPFALIPFQNSAVQASNKLQKNNQ